MRFFACKGFPFLKKDSLSSHIISLSYMDKSTSTGFTYSSIRPAFASAVNVMTTLLCIVTMPLMTQIYMTLI